MKQYINLLINLFSHLTKIDIPHCISNQTLYVCVFECAILRVLCAYFVCIKTTRFIQIFVLATSSLHTFASSSSSNRHQYTKCTSPQIYKKKKRQLPGESLNLTFCTDSQNQLFIYNTLWVVIVYAIYKYTKYTHPKSIYLYIYHSYRTIKILSALVLFLLIVCLQTS